MGSFHHRTAAAIWHSSGAVVRGHVCDTEGQEARLKGLPKMHHEGLFREASGAGVKARRVVFGSLAGGTGFDDLS
jgi:hypothetical protein